MIAPTPPRANFSSQLIRVCVPEPSSLSKRPEMLERKMRFLTSRPELRNLMGLKIAALLMRGLPGVLRLLPDLGEQSGDDRMCGTSVPSAGEKAEAGIRPLPARGFDGEHDERARLQTDIAHARAVARLADDARGTAQGARQRVLRAERRKMVARGRELAHQPDRLDDV